MRKIFTLFVFSASFLIFTSCLSTKHRITPLSRQLMAQGKLSPERLCNYFMSQNPNAYEPIIDLLAHYYYDEAAEEGINSDVAFAQMCLETGYLTYGNLVQPEWHNYCGLGAMDKEHPGEQFETELMGVRAHIQHLQAYATTEETTLNNELIDPRYSWVHKTKFTEDIFGLAGTWATDKQYGNKIDAILSKMEHF